jgi:sugar phosphate permease
MAARQDALTSQAPNKTKQDGSSAHASPMRWVVAFILFVAVMSAFFDRIIVSVLFTNKAFQADLGIGFDPVRLGFLMTAFVFAYGVSGVALSFLGDLFGPRRCLAAGAVLWGAGMTAMGAASSFVSMASFRVLLGVAEGPQFSLINSVIKRWFPPGEQARANSIWMVGSPLGSAIGFPLTIWLVLHYGWRAAFYALAALNLVIVLPLLLVFVRDRPQGPAADAVESERHPDADPRQQTSYRDQLAEFIGEWRFWMLVIFNSAALIYLWGLNTWLPSYLIRERHFNPSQLGVFSSLPFIFMFFGEILSAALSDRLGKRAIICFVTLLCAGLCMYLVALIPDSRMAALMIAVSAFFWGGALPPLFALGLRVLPAGAVATGVGVYNGIGNLIGALSPWAMGAIIAATGSFNAGLLVIIGAAIVGSFAMVPLIRNY